MQNAKPGLNKMRFHTNVVSRSCYTVDILPKSNTQKDTTKNHHLWLLIVIKQISYSFSMSKIHEKDNKIFK
jgi:hypothetical protein